MANLQRTDAALRYTVALVALLNIGYFGVEFAVALTIGSVSLFADSIDFLEDATVNGLILVALGWNARQRSLVGMLLAAVLLAPAIATLWTAWQKLQLPVPPAPVRKCRQYFRVLHRSGCFVATVTNRDEDLVEVRFLRAFRDRV